MSSTILNVVFSRAIQLWADPRHRCKGKLRRKSKHGIQYCAIGVLQQARKDCGISYRALPTKKLAKALGFDETGDLWTFNDKVRMIGAWCSCCNIDDECVKNRYHQDIIYNRMVDFVKGTL
jgi:hypothetical protein